MSWKTPRPPAPAVSSSISRKAPTADCCNRSSSTSIRATFFITDRALDFSVVALKGNLSNISKFGWNGLSAAEGKLIVGEYVSIIQHPSGERKQLALRENQVVDVLDNFAHYRTDTSPGSSGSPVFSTASGSWSGCTTRAVPKKDRTAARSSRSTGARCGTRSMGDDKIHWIANEGARISKILRHIQGLSLSGPQATLRQQLLQSEKGWTGGRESTEQIAVEGVEAGRGPNSWTLPLAADHRCQRRNGRRSASVVGPPKPALRRLRCHQWHAASMPLRRTRWSAPGAPTKAPPTRRRPQSRRAAVPAPPPRVETAAEWLTGAPSAPATMQEQFGRAA